MKLRPEQPKSPLIRGIFVVIVMLFGPWIVGRTVFQAKLRLAAGLLSPSCAFVRSIRDERSGAISCATGYVASGRAFIVAFREPGIDSGVIVGYGQNEEGHGVRVDYDSNVMGGGCPGLFHVTTRPCPTPRFNSTGPAPAVECDANRG